MLNTQLLARLLVKIRSKMGHALQTLQRLAQNPRQVANQQNMIGDIWGELATFTSTRIIWEPHVLHKCWRTLLRSLIWKALISYYPHKHVKLKAKFGLGKSEWFIKTLWMTVIQSVHSPPFIVHPTVGLNTANNQIIKGTSKPCVLHDLQVWCEWWWPCRKWQVKSFYFIEAIL